MSNDLATCLDTLVWHTPPTAWQFIIGADRVPSRNRLSHYIWECQHASYEPPLEMHVPMAGYVRPSWVRTLDLIDPLIIGGYLSTLLIILYRAHLPRPNLLTDTSSAYRHRIVAALGQDGRPDAIIFSLCQREAPLSAKCTIWFIRETRVLNCNM